MSSTVPTPMSRPLRYGSASSEAAVMAWKLAEELGSDMPSTCRREASMGGDAMDGESERFVRAGD